MKNITILGATGSIGDSTLDVIARHPDRYRVYALTANVGVDKLAAQALRFSPRYVVLRDASAAERLRQLLTASGCPSEVLAGEEGLARVAGAAGVDVVVAAIVGAAGLRSTLAAVEAGKQVLLANKEALVMAGPLFMDAVARSGATLLPLDSEHNAIFQCMPSDFGRGLSQVGVRRILLTGSGGPFRTVAPEALARVTPAEACRHPNWSMGPKISVDSATMMNKGLELIEACWLFDARPQQVEIVIHPQSVIHSMVEYVDGSVLAQLGHPDMRTPIAHALAWPDRISAGVPLLDLVAQARLDFEAPDFVRFPLLRLAVAAAERGGSAPALINAANEVAVAAFLAERIRFTEIASIVERVLEQVAVSEPASLEDVEVADALARDTAAAAVAAIETEYPVPRAINQ